MLLRLYVLLRLMKALILPSGGAPDSLICRINSGTEEKTDIYGMYSVLLNSNLM